MGKKRVSFVGEEKQEKKASAVAPKEKKEKKIAGRVLPEKKKKKPKKKEGRKRERGKRYLVKKKLVKKERLYSAVEAVKLLKKTSLTRFPGMAEAHLVVSKKGMSVKVKFPYHLGKERRVVIADDPQTMAKIKEGKIDFDVLLATPKMMPKLVPFARFLGPRGLMPNPKNGTIVNDPKKAIKQIKEGGVEVKTEKKAPLIHTVFGRVDDKEENLVANLQTLIRSVGKNNIRKLVIKATMGPGIKVKLTS